ncbi:uncharacterized protein LOC142538531 [Primulina tabacum]|uniref:uncharacterized protein LOC142538531 n=1 Tax=Primulina tabacum TaxID=48773 RepID=UPI003F59C77B
MVQQNQFAGTATSDPHVHLRTFSEITDTVKINNVPDDIIRLRLFPFSLRDQARGWLQSLPLGSITTWQELATKFLAKYIPPAKSAQLKIEISTFRQTDFEQLYEAWERYKELLRKCPNHGFEDWVQIELFYNGLNGQTRGTVDAAAGGTIFAKSPEQAYDLLEQMTINSYQWPSERAGVKRTAGVYAVDPITSLTAQVSALTTQLAAMNKLATALRDQNMGQFPSNTEVNPKEQCKAVTLRSGKELEVQIPKDRVESEKTVEERKNKESKTEVEVERPPFIKDVMSKKRKLQEFETVNLTEECSAILQKKLPQKLKDPGSFTIPSFIGGSKCSKALCDLGASINLMPFSIYRELEHGEVKPTTITLQLADRSLTYPRGIVEDVLVKVDKFIFPADFVILDMEEDHDAPLIFGRTVSETRDPLESCLAAETADEETWEVKEQRVALEAL